MREMHDKDRLLEWCCLRIDGYSYREIAEQYGVSFQAVQNAINRNIVNVTRKPKKIVYPELSNWMSKNHVNVKEMAEMLGITASCLYTKFRGEQVFSKKQIDQLLKITGMSYEKLFSEEK